MKNFKPQLCPNEQPDLDKLRFPLLASFKYDGIRAIFMNGQLYSRALKPILNVHLNKRFQAIKEYSKNYNGIFDGEFWTDSVSFNELSGIIRSDDKEIPDDLYFYCFDYLDGEDKPFFERVKQYNALGNKKYGLTYYFSSVVQKIINDKETLEASFDFALKHGFEGLILRNPTSKYKFGRATLKEDIAYKMKPYLTYDSKIISITQATEAREGSEKKVNELGHSVTSQKKADRVLIGKAATFVVLHNGNELGVSLPMTDEEKIYIWNNQEEFIGKTIEYKGLAIGSKHVPRHCVFIRYRGDKDESN